jgi:carbamoylphosphate synthase small subunit
MMDASTMSTLAIILGIAILAVALGYNTAHRNLGHESFAILGNSLIDSSCRIQTHNGQPYKMNATAEVQRQAQLRC